MSKIDEKLIESNGEVYDSYKEHELHTEVDEHCSECYKLIADKIKVVEED